MSATMIAVIVIAVLAIAFGVFMYLQRERSRRLRGRYGPEYDRLVDHYGSARKAEFDLVHREKRVEAFHIRSLTPDETTRFAEAWRLEQGRFVDNPREAVARADSLVIDLMKVKGYPMADFERRAEDLSVDHPDVVRNYRLAHDIAQLDARGEATTEDLRKAIVHYRALFEDLLESGTVRKVPTPVQRQKVVEHT